MVAVHRESPTTSVYLERAMLLWPRLDRARLRRVADDPLRLAGLIERRTSQPRDVIVAMLTQQIDLLAAPNEPIPIGETGRPEATRVALRIVRTDTGTKIEVQDLQPA